MVLGDAAGPVSQLTPEHRYRPGTSHGVSLRPRRTRVKRSLGRGRELSIFTRLTESCQGEHVLEGSVVMQVKGGKQVTLTPGQLTRHSPRSSTRRSPS